MKTNKMIAAMLLFMAVFSACKKDRVPEPELAKPTIDKVEIGLNNSEIGVIGRDFHLNAEILAGDRIETVQILIRQRAGETYTKVWNHEIVYSEYKGAKNATVHKHFDVPTDAPEGKYDFLIIVNDQNGTKLEEKRNIIIYDPINLPVDPQEALFNISRRGKGFFYRRGVFNMPGARMSKVDTLNAQISISSIKGSGKMYVLMINKKHNHRPESIADIDFNKAIVYDVYEHSDLTATTGFSNYVSNPRRDQPILAIGAANDNNTPVPNPINGAKAWETGEYYFGYIYLNTTYNISIFKYVEFGVDY